MAGVLIEFTATSEGFRPDIADAIEVGNTAETTDNPIEDGSSVSDHRIIAPKTLHITGFITNVPLDSDKRRHEIEALGAHTEWRERLERAHATSEFLNVDIGPHRGGTYKNMQITSLPLFWGVEGGNGYNFSIDLKEVPVAKPKTRNLTDERIKQQKFGLGAFSGGVLAGLPNPFQTLVNSVDTLSRFQPVKDLGRVTGLDQVGKDLESKVKAVANPLPAVTGAMKDFVKGFF